MLVRAQVFWVNTVFVVFYVFSPLTGYASTIPGHSLGPVARLQTVPSIRVQTTFPPKDVLEAPAMVSMISPDEIPLIDIQEYRIAFQKRAQQPQENIPQSVRVLYERIAVIPGPASLEVVAEEIGAQEENTDDADMVPRPERLLANALSAGLRAFSIEAPLPSRELLFELSGKVIPIKHTTVYRDEYHFEDGSPVFDMIEGSLTVSGACANLYYSVLVYRDADDYIHDPVSYIASKRYLCVGNEYSFKLKDLPEHLRDGNYYLLIADQGVEASWRPISDLFEVTISGR